MNTLSEAAVLHNRYCLRFRNILNKPEAASRRSSYKRCSFLPADVNITEDFLVLEEQLKMLG